jgi:hypothetical protein
MSVQKGSYYDTPVRGYHGEIAVLGNYKAGLQIAYEDISVGLGVEKIANLSDPNKIGSFSFKVRRWRHVYPLLGVSLRVPGLKGTDANSQDSVPFYEKDSEINYLQQGYMWILLDENSAAVTIANSKAFVAFNSSTFQPGTIVNTFVPNETFQVSTIRFVSKAQPGEMVKIWVNCLLK